LHRSYFLALLLLLSPIVDFARETAGVESPAFTTVPELSAAFDLLYEQRFTEAREAFASWESAIRRSLLVKVASRPAIFLRSYPAKAY